MAKWLDKYEQGGLVLKKKTKDNYGKKPNVNDVQASAGPNFVGEGYTAYNWKSPAWGGQFAMGGALPGSVGFMYARTQNPAPANGKYTKKTLASAQNGQEMKYYQDGLDFKPKSISKKGKKIVKDDRGQWAHPGEVTEIGSNDITMQGVDYPVLGISDTGDTQMMYPDQDYKFDGEKVTEYPMAQDGSWLDKYQDGGNINKKLKEEAEERLSRMGKPKSTISQYTPKPGEQSKFDKQKLERIAEDNAPLNRMAASKGARNMQDAIEAALIMEGGLAAGKLVGKGAKAAGKYLTEETALKNAYKLNPLAFKANPEAYYRMVGEAGYADALKSGVVRPPIGSGHTEAYYNKGYPLDTRLRDVTGRAGYEGPYMAEVKGNKELFVDENVAGYTGPMFDDPVVYSKEPISISNPSVKLYKENWLKGYKEVAKPTSTQQITRGPINWWDEPKYKKQNPNFDPETYLNNPVGNQFYSRDIPKGMEPRYFEEKKNGGWLNKYK
jgi:hypothetical protein